MRSPAQSKGTVDPSARGHDEREHAPADAKNLRNPDPDWEYKAALAESLIQPTPSDLHAANVKSTTAASLAEETRPLPTAPTGTTLKLAKDDGLCLGWAVELGLAAPTDTFRDALVQDPVGKLLMARAKESLWRIPALICGLTQYDLVSGATEYNAGGVAPDMMVYSMAVAGVSDDVSQ